MNDTKEKLLDAAEFLFGEYGYSDTSLRQIISRAQANLASIHYHFGSKEELLDQVILRKAGPINEERLKLLDRFEFEAAPNPVPVEKIVEAIVMPVMMTTDRQFIKLMGRMLLEGLMADIARRRFHPLTERFFAAAHRTLPDMPREELVWRLHFTIGAMAYTLLVRPEACHLEVAAQSQAAIARRLITFMSWGFRAPAVTEKEIEVNQ